MARTPDTRRGDAFRRWLRGLPRTTRRLVVTGLVIAWLGAWYVALLVIERALDDGEASWTEPLSSMIGPLIGVGLVFWLRRRALGSFGRVWELDEAARRRRLPDDADPAEWGPLLESAHRFQSRARKLAVGFILLVLIVTILLVAWAGFGWAVVVAVALMGAALVALLEFTSRRQLARIDILQDQVRGLPDRGPLTPGG